MQGETRAAHVSCPVHLCDNDGGMFVQCRAVFMWLLPQTVAGEEEHSPNPGVKTDVTRSGGSPPPPPSNTLATNERVRARARRAQVSKGPANGDSSGTRSRILLLRVPSLIFVTAEPISMVTCSGNGNVIWTSFGKSLSKLNALRL